MNGVLLGVKKISDGGDVLLCDMEGCKAAQHATCSMQNDTRAQHWRCEDCWLLAGERVSLRTDVVKGSSRRSRCQPSMPTAKRKRTGAAGRLEPPCSRNRPSESRTHPAGVLACTSGGGGPSEHYRCPTGKAPTRIEYIPPSPSPTATYTLRTCSHIVPALLAMLMRLVCTER